ncbi:MAG: 16S rRNA processing protein RimM [Nitrospinae bacterium]|nr:16S rRNA processing protein RimM [Nitrospinota bacterium]
MAAGKVACGRFLKPFGVSGEIKFEPYLPDDLEPSSLLSGIVRHAPAKGMAEKEIVIASARPLAGGVWALRPDGCDSPEDAAWFTNTELWVDRSLIPAMPEGQYLAHDIIGCRVTDTAGNTIGSVTGILATGANDVWEVQTLDGKEVLIPAVQAIVARVDVEARRITINVIEGLLD